MPNKQTVARRNRDTVLEGRMNASKKFLSATDVASFVAAKGLEFVVDQISRGNWTVGQAGRAMLKKLGQNVIQTGAEWYQRGSPTMSAASSAPASVGVMVRGLAPTSGSTRIRHRELIPPMEDGTTRRVSPTNSALFPYLAAMASNYNKYIVHSLTVKVVSGRPTSEAGRWYLAWVRDSTDSIPVDPSDVMSHQHSVSLSKWQSGSLSVPKSLTTDGGMYLSYFPDQDKDHGYITSRGLADLDVYVEYDVELRDPQLGVNSTQFTGNILGAAPGKAGRDFIVHVGPGQYSLADGYYSFSAYFAGTGLTTNYWSATNATLSTKHARYPEASPGTEAWQVGFIDASTFGNTVLTITNTATTITKSVFSITPISRYQFDQAK